MTHLNFALPKSAAFQFYVHTKIFARLALIVLLIVSALGSTLRAVSPPVVPPPVSSTIAPTDAAGWMFDHRVVVDINLDIPPSSMEQIPTYMEAERPYVPATFSMSYTQGEELQRSFGPWEVSLKVKGMYGSFRNLPAGEKAGLKIKFPKGQRPDGLKKFTLNNMVQDGSMIREVLAYHTFRSLGIPAPRTGYARVTINGTYYGIYLNLETMDDIALPRWYSTTGHLYEGSYGSWWGDVGDPFSGHYEVDEGDEEDRADLQKLITTAQSPARGWLRRMYPVANLEQMTRMWACEWFTGHWDGYSQNLANNYYLHSDASGRFTILPWGTDQTFTWADRFNESPDHFIFNNCLRDPAGRAMYTDALQYIARRWINLKLENLANEAYTSVATESGGIDDVKWFIQARLSEHREWSANLPAPPTGVRAVQLDKTVNRTISISWKSPFETKDAPITRGYVVEYRTPTTAWTRTSRRYSSSALLYQLPKGTYTLRVRAVGDHGDSLPATTTIKIL
ncbi:MAG: hypothetical protein RLY69_306 [Verrucomicrobiota bacterium]